MINLTKKQSEKKYAEIVLLEINFNKIFHYSIPENLQSKISCGTRVIIPFKNSKKTGCVVGLLTRSSIKNCKNILQVIDKESFLNPNLLQLTKWISEYYLCSWSKTLNYVFPKTKKLWLKQWEKEILTSEEPSISKPLESEKQSILAIQEKNEVLKQVFNSIIKNMYKVFYLNPTNFSQKVKFYVKCIQTAQSIQKQVIILTPSEIELRELAEALKVEFKDKILIFDERDDQKSNFFQWIKIKKSKFDIVIGKRSAIFLPMEQLSLIIVDQEYDSLYKEERTPRYHAEKVAIKRAEIEDIPIILHSNSPSLESFQGIAKKTIEKIELTDETKEDNLSKNKIIDMTQEKSKKKIISYELQQAIAKNIKKSKQIILFLNRRGFSSFILCNKCGYIPKCPSCNNVLSYHFDNQLNARLICHSCGKRIEMLNICPKCGSREMRPLGVGTQRLENEIKKMFPMSKIKRVDRDTIKKKEDYQEMIEDFNNRKIDILIGTKIALKGVNYDHVDLLGIVSADTLLNLPDFRSGEKTFQLIKEIVLSFRRSDSYKEVIIQTFNPDHHCLVALKKGKDNIFYQKELELRKELEYPPFTHIIKIEVKGEDKEKVKEDAKSLINYLEQLGSSKSVPKYEILGSKNMIIWKAKNVFKVQLIVKVKNIEKFNKLFMKRFDKIILGQLYTDNRILIDVDPTRMI
ncbi:MAG: primosomal protein N' [Candidatus Caldatribacteriota bacterium]|nr:primosomal protein N' [Candidatus Caldatribacteriota bacterium]